jgi:hypothetical protein
MPSVKAASTPLPVDSPKAYTVRVPDTPPAVSRRTQALSSVPVVLLYRRATRSRTNSAPSREAASRESRRLLGR